MKVNLAITDTLQKNSESCLVGFIRYIQLLPVTCAFTCTSLELLQAISIFCVDAVVSCLCISGYLICKDSLQKLINSPRDRMFDFSH